MLCCAFPFFCILVDLSIPSVFSPSTNTTRWFKPSVTCDPAARGTCFSQNRRALGRGVWRSRAFVCLFVCCVSLGGLHILWGSSFWVSAPKFLRVEAQCCFVSTSLDFVSECWSRWILLKSKTVRVERKFYAGVILGRGFHFVDLTCSNGLLWSNELEFKSEGKKFLLGEEPGMTSDFWAKLI